MKVRWQVDDGYSGKSRPQETLIDDEELNECETEMEKEDLIYYKISCDFERKISWYRI